MRSNKNRIVSRLLTVFWVVICGVLFTVATLRAMAISRANLRVEAVVVATVEQKQLHNGRIHYCSTFEWTHGGERFQDTSDDCYEAKDGLGKKTNLRIDPGDPSNWQIDRRSARYGPVWGLFAAGMFALAGAVAGVRRWNMA